MAVITSVINSKLKLALDNGLNEKGEVIVKSKTFSNVSASALDEDVYEVGEALAGLQTLEVEEISRVNEIRITKEA